MNKTSIGVVAIIVLAFVTSIVAWNVFAGIQEPHASQRSSSQDGTNLVPSVGALQIGAYSSPPVTLLSVATVEHMLNRSLILPSASDVSSISPALKLVGAVVDDSTPGRWEVTIYYSTNQTFVNGTTTINDLVGTDGLYLIENPAPAGVNSSEVAHAELAPPTATVCHTISGASVQCQTLSGEANVGSHLVVQNGLTLVVNPSGNIVSWTDDRQLMNEAIGGGSNVTIDQLLILAATMT